MLTFRLSLELIALIAIGFFIWRKGMVDEHFDTSLTNFIMKISLPCLIIGSFNAPFSAAELKNCILLIFLSLIMMGVWFLIGQTAFKLSGGGHWGRVVRFGSVFTNFSFVGMPVVEALFGQQGLLYFSVFTVPIRMVYYSSAQPLLSPPGAKLEKKSAFEHIKGWFSPPIIAVFIGMALYISGLQLPEVLDKTISAVGSICSPMGMILCGISLGKNKLTELLKLRYLRLPLFRNLLLPAVTLAIMYFLPVDALVAKIVVIYAALPVASLLAAYTIKYDPDPQARLEGAGSVFISLLFFALTIPLWARITEAVF